MACSAPGRRPIGEGSSEPCWLTLWMRPLVDGVNVTVGRVGVLRGGRGSIGGVHAGGMGEARLEPREGGMRGSAAACGACNPFRGPGEGGRGEALSLRGLT